MQKRTDRQRQLEAFLNHFAGESAINPKIGEHLIGLESTAKRENLLKEFAISYGSDPTLVDEFRLGDIEASDFGGFLLVAWEKSGATRYLSGRERKA
jgi:hypothetical protein